jgi:hypothetical protein
MTAPTAPADTITSAGTTRIPGPRPSWFRLVALAMTSFLTLALPVMWGATALLYLVTGVEADHRFHQIIGQGLVLSVLWLSGLVPIVVAGWRRRPPAPGVVIQHAAFVAATVLAGGYAPQNGGLVVAGIVLVTTGLLWWALPAPLPLRVRTDALDPLATPLALLAAALLVPYGLAEGGIQRTSHDEHAQMSHYFDMAWVAFAAAACMLSGHCSPAPEDWPRLPRRRPFCGRRTLPVRSGAPRRPCSWPP